MKRRCLLAGLFGMALSLPALAHRLNVFAWEEGETIHVEAKFSNGKAAQGARVSLYRGDVLIQETKTQSDGTATFPSACQEQLSVRVLAAGGHLGQTPLLAQNTIDQASANASQVILTRGQYETLLANARPKAPGLIEIVGGMGWLVGLAGLFSYWRMRKK